MKKILLCGVAALAVAAASPAKAEGIDLGLGGYFIGYGVYTDSDNDDNLRSFDFRKETEIHVNGETTLDNGLTVGAHIELDVDKSDDLTGGTNSTIIEESYMYLSGGWGRVNFGQEDGASYLLQVAAPSADDNIDGLRPDINTFDLANILNGTPSVGSSVLDYASDPTAYSNKLTYITPLFNGFQMAASFTPSVSDSPIDSEAARVADNNAGQFDTAYEVAGRYQAIFSGADVTFGAGYASLQTEADAATTLIGSDDQDVFNVGARVGFDAFGVGVSYVDDNNGVDTNGDTDILVVGTDYVTGPFKFGLSYYDRTDEANAAGTTLGTTGSVGDVDTTRWTAGVGYQYGPGMSLNGSVAYVDIEDDATSGDGFQVGLGTRVDF